MMFEFVDNLDLVKFVICALVSRVHMMFYTLRKGYIAPGNQGIHDKLDQIQHYCIIHSGAYHKST